MKYGFWRDPSFRSKSSTVNESGSETVLVLPSPVKRRTWLNFESPCVYSQKQRKSVSTHMLYTLKNP